MARLGKTSARTESRGSAVLCAAICAVGVWLPLLLVPGTASAGAWLPPVLVSGAHVAPQAVAADGRGTAVALVRQFPSGLAAVSLPAGQAPGTPYVLSMAAVDGDVAMDADGNAVAVWIEGAGVRAAFRAADGMWSSPQDLVVPTEASATGLRVAMSADGLAVATWSRSYYDVVQAVGNSIVEAAVKLEGSTAFGPVTELAADAARPDVAVAPGGDAVLVWTQYDPTASEVTIQGAARPAGGSFARLGDLFAPRDGSRTAEGPRVAMDARGRATAVWAARHYEEPCNPSAQNCTPAGFSVFDVQAAERGVSGDFGAPQTIATSVTNSRNGNIVVAPQVVVEADGTAVVVWTDGVADVFYGIPGWGRYGVRWAQRPAGGSFTSPSLAFPEFESLGTTPVTLAMAPNGTAMVMAGAVQSSVRRPGGAFGRPQDVARGAGVPVLAFADDGDAVALWYDDAGLQAARYDLTAPSPAPKLILNGGFETNLAEWTTPEDTRIVLTREAAGHTGEWAARIANTGTSPGTCVLKARPAFALRTATGMYTATLWVRGATAGQTLRLRLSEYESMQYGSTLFGGRTSTPLTLTTSWQRVTLKYTPAAPGRSILDLHAYVSDAAPGTCFFADDASLVHDPTARNPDLVNNAGFETSSADWNTAGSATGVVLSRDSGGHSGDWAASLANTATTAGTCTLNDSPNIVATTAPGTYTATLWVRSPTPGQTLRLKLREYAKATGSLLASHTTPVTLTTSWQPVTVAHTPTAPGSSTLDLNAYVSGAPPGTCFLADDAALVFLPPPAPEPNLVANASFEYSLSGWNTSGSAPAVVLTREHVISQNALQPQWNALLANTASTPSTCTLNDSPNVVATTQPGTYTATLRVRGAPQTLKLRLREYNGATLLGSQVTAVTLGPDWQQVSVSYTPLAPGTSTLDLHAYVTGAPPGFCFMADDVTIQRH